VQPQILNLQNVAGEWYFYTRGLRNTGDNLARLVATCARTRLLSDWTAGIPLVLRAFESEYKSYHDPTLFDEQSRLIASARAINQNRVDIAYSSISNDLIRDLPFEYIESQLIVQFGNLKRTFLASLTGTSQNPVPINLRLDEMQLLLLSYCYNSLYEGIFEEALNFNDALCQIVSQPIASNIGTGIRDRVNRINQLGFNRLTFGFDPTVRNGTAHGHITIERSGNFTYRDRGLSVTKSYAQLESDYEELKKIAYFWQLMILIHTMEAFAQSELR
jgi:hypothetical protein